MPLSTTAGARSNEGINAIPEGHPQRIAVIGAGIGGLATALRLRAAGHAVTLLDRHRHPGGKMRGMPSAAGPVDAGPTVLTMRHVFDDLFAAAGTRTEDHVTLHPEPLLARHFWPDGKTLDLFSDPAASAEAVGRAFGPKATRQFQAFSAAARRLFEAFDHPMMQAPEPAQSALTAKVLKDPRLIADMAPGLTLARKLALSFSNPHLRQLFGRYATYVGGSPYESPALLSLIWHAEASGVWRVEGGMHHLARVIADLFAGMGGTLRLGDGAARIETQGGRVTAVHTESGARHDADLAVYAGDPRALAQGYLGPAAACAVTLPQTEPRSLSAWVWSFAAEPFGPVLAHHNVFFTRDPRAEFRDLAAGRMPGDGTLYICAQDRGGPAPEGLERFEIILNGAPDDSGAPCPDEERTTCQTRVFQALRDFGLSFRPRPDATALTTPADFAAMFPASAGSLYGPSPHGLTAALKKPTARSSLPGLYLAGGAVHPGAGVPMAALSGRHAAAAIAADLALTSPSRRTAMPGGMSTVSARMKPAPFRSSAS